QRRRSTADRSPHPLLTGRVEPSAAQPDRSASPSPPCRSVTLVRSSPAVRDGSTFHCAALFQVTRRFWLSAAQQDQPAPFQPPQRRLQAPFPKGLTGRTEDQGRSGAV